MPKGKKTVLFAYNRVEDIAYTRTTESSRCIVKQNVTQHPHCGIRRPCAGDGIFSGIEPNRKQLDFTPQKVNSIHAASSNWHSTTAKSVVLFDSLRRKNNNGARKKGRNRVDK